jgi:hypothetical protein
MEWHIGWLGVLFVGGIVLCLGIGLYRNFMGLKAHAKACEDSINLLKYEKRKQDEAYQQMAQNNIHLNQEVQKWRSGYATERHQVQLRDKMIASLQAQLAAKAQDSPAPAESTPVGIGQFWHPNTKAARSWRKNAAMVLKLNIDGKEVEYPLIYSRN